MPKYRHKAVKVKTSQEFVKAIENIKEKVKANYSPLRIVLFGSCLHGNVTEDSDIDMLIIKDTSDSVGERWMKVCKIARDLERRIPFEPIILTPEEVKERLKIGDFFLQEILTEGKVLYEKEQ